MQDNQPAVSLRSDADGHWVTWHKDDISGILGPYQDRDMAENVRAAKARELTENHRPIDEASPFRHPEPR